MRRLLLCCAWCLCVGAQAAPWTFDAPIGVTGQATPGVFAHLASAGRKNIAVSAGWVAVAWEDNRDGVPRCYVTLKAPGQQRFGDAVRISMQEEAAEPALIALDDGRFVVAWEEAGRVWARSVSAESMGAPLALHAAPAAQVSLARAAQGVYAVWSAQEQYQRLWQIQLAQLKVTAQGELRALRSAVVDTTAEGDQSYPSVAALGPQRVMVAWEDRRAGHTRLFSAVSRDGGKHFAASRQLNESIWRGAALKFGRGTGVMRVALTAQGRDGIAAVWADKRDFQSGYDVYGGLARGVQLRFGPNEKVQDAFGNNITQWHPALAANRDGRLAAVWDDDRDGTPDVWLSWRNAEGWADNVAVPGASGAGVQSDPSLALDEAGNLHLTWVEKETLNSPSRICYVFGRAQ